MKINRISFRFCSLFLSFYLSGCLSTAWRDNGFSVDQQEEWKSTMGYQISDIPKAVTWRNFGFTPAQAKECGVNDPLQLSSFFTNGSSRFRPEEVCAWNASGYKGSDAENWSKYGLRLPDVQACRLLGIVFEEAVSWFEFSFTSCAKILEWRNSGFDAVTAKAWRDSGVHNPDQVIVFKKYNLNESEVSAILKAGFPIDETKTWSETTIFIKLKDLYKSKKLDVISGSGLKNMLKIVKPEKYAHWIKDGSSFENLILNARWASLNLSFLQFQILSNDKLLSDEVYNALNSGFNFSQLYENFKKLNPLKAKVETLTNEINIQKDKLLARSCRQIYFDVIQKLSPNAYEVQLYGVAGPTLFSSTFKAFLPMKVSIRAILKTVNTTFKTRGQSNLWVRTEGVRNVTMQSGLRESVDVVVEERKCMKEAEIYFTKAKKIEELENEIERISLIKEKKE